jgi:hypothetical protein
MQTSASDSKMEDVKNWFALAREDHAVNGAIGKGERSRLDSWRRPEP